jgi:hypothetical protein
VARHALCDASLENVVQEGDASGEPSTEGGMRHASGDALCPHFIIAISPHSRHLLSLMLIIAYFENWGKRLAKNNIMVSCLEAVNHPTLLLTPILHALKVFEQNMTFTSCSTGVTVEWCTHMPINSLLSTLIHAIWL